MIPEALHRLARKCSSDSPLRQAFNAYVRARTLEAEEAEAEAESEAAADAVKKAYAELIAAMPDGIADALFKAILAMDFARRNTDPTTQALLDVWIHQVAKVALNDSLVPVLAERVPTNGHFQSGHEHQEVD